MRQYVCALATLMSPPTAAAAVSRRPSAGGRGSRANQSRRPAASGDAGSPGNGGKNVLLAGVNTQGTGIAEYAFRDEHGRPIPPSANFVASLDRAHQREQQLVVNQQQLMAQQQALQERYDAALSKDENY